MKRVIKNILNPSLFRQFRKNDRNLCNHHLADPIFSVTVYASTASRKGNRCAQVYATDFGSARAYPIAFRSKAHETLLLFFSRNGVPPACICDNDNNMIQAKFYQKLTDAVCHLKQSEPHDPWPNAVEKRLKSLQMGLVVSCCGPGYQIAYGMTD